MSRRPATLLAALLLVAPLLVSDSADAAKECFGKRITAKVTEGVPFVGGPGNDVILGTQGNDVIDGGDGNDRICSLGGNDDVQGGIGDDKVNGGTGVDVLVGDINGDGDLVGGGNDLLKSGDGYIQEAPLRIEQIIGDSWSSDGEAGGGGNDVLDGGSDGARMIGDSRGAHGTSGGGNDTLRRGIDVIFGDSFAEGGDESVEVHGSGNDLIEDTQGVGAIIVGDSRAEAEGASSTSATFSTFVGADIQGRDVISGTGGSDILVGDHSASGNQVAFIGSADDTIKGLGGADTLFGDCSVGLEHYTSSAQSPQCDDFSSDYDGGADRLNGGTGDDDLLGGFGPDAMNGGSDTDRCDGQGSPDTFTNCEQEINAP